MHVLIAPDKFKGSLSAAEVCDAIEKGLLEYDDQIQVTKIPLADGGEGTLDVLESVLDVKRVHVKVHNPMNEQIVTYYLRNGDTAYIEMAMASGLQLIPKAERNMVFASSYGTGELILHAQLHGVKRIYLFVGGSATNDGGTGMAEALGYEFYWERGKVNKMCGDALIRLEQIKDKRHPKTKELEITVLTDVENELLGPQGATMVYGRQKGIVGEAAEVLYDLERGMTHLTDLIGNGNEKSEGAGAAGGLAYGAMSFLGAEVKPGIDTLMTLLGLDEKLKRVDLILTGEGSLDEQTLSGKVIAGLAGRAKLNNIPIGIFCGKLDLSKKDLARLNPAFVAEVSSRAKDMTDSIKNASEYLSQMAFEEISHFKSGLETS